MNFAALRDMPLSSFIEESRDTSAFWFFLHVPKTAGSSFATELRKRLKPCRNIHADPKRGDTTYSDSLGQSLKTFLSLPDRNSYRAASGHLPFRKIEPLRKRIPNARIVTFLRSPEKRVVSGFRYRRTSAHKEHEKFREQFPTLQSFVDDAISHNLMARYVGGRGIDRDTLLRRVDHDFAFVGLLEMYPMSFNIAFDIMGFPGCFPERHKNKTVDTEDNAIEVTPAILKRIRELNQLDIALYEHVHEILAPHQQAWEASMAARAEDRAPAA